jgi:hypothetical protein
LRAATAILSVEDKLLAHVRLHRPADDPAAEQVLHRREVQPPLTGADLLDVRAPDAVGSLGAEVAADEIAEWLHALHAHGAALAAAPASAL